MDDPQRAGHRTQILPAVDGGPGLEIVDPIERLRRTIRTAEPVSPEPADPDAFALPVETAVAVETDELTLPVESQVIVHDGDGHMVEEVQLGSTSAFPEGTYYLEPIGIIKTFLRVEGAFEVVQTGEATRIDLAAAAPVLVGSCSTHEQPATSVTIREDPADLLAALSTFGSALKTTSPERSFPTFRGHPPTVEVGAERAIPEGLSPPAESVRVEVPAEYEPAFLVAPLAYYLGAPVVEGPVPTIVGEDLEHPIAHRGDLEAGVERTLGRLFLLDCLTRTEGMYQLDVHERERFEERAALPFAELYEASHEERVRAYLEVPHETVADLVPDWKQVAHVDPVPENAAALPFLVDDLSLLRTAEPEPVPEAEIEHGTAQGLVRGSATTDATFVQPAEPAEAIEETWVGEGTPLGPSKAIGEAFENRLGRSTSTGSIDIAVVCNEEAMAEEEDALEATYGTRSELPFDVTVRRDTTAAELADLLAEERDFLHYIGHIGDEGFRCEDGRLDARELEDVGVDAFFLNACQSYEQGVELVRAGAVGGIVTVRDVANFGAVKIGGAVARLLNCGFPLRSALDVAREESVIGSHYVVVGDGGLHVVQPQSGTPHLLEAKRVSGEFEVSVDLFGAQPGMGGLFSLHLERAGQHYLASGRVPKMRMSEDEFEEFLPKENCPVRRNGWLAWSSELSIEDF